MATRDFNDDKDAASSGSGLLPPRCAADDLKVVLQHITDQISDADRRHSATLLQLQERLSALGAQTEQVRTRVPEEFAPAFERIEDGMAQLARRLATAPRDWLVEPERAPAARVAPAVAPQAEPSSRQSFAAKADELSFGPVEQMQPAVAVPAADEAPVLPDLSAIATALKTSAPAPLRSAMPARDRADEQAASSQAPKPDPFEFAEYPASPDVAQSWDKEQADALARIYDQGEAFGLAHVAKAPLTEQHPPMPAASPAPIAVPAAALPHLAAAASMGAETPAPAAIPAADRDWLEQKFADIARRVEQSLVEGRPENALIALDQRFDQLEQRLGLALDDVATRSDVEGLRLVEAHINELASHVEQTQAQLARLDGIESQLGELITRMSEEHLGKMLNVAGPSSVELESVANLVAERFVERMPKPAPQVPGGIDRMDEVRRAIESLIHEQRLGGEQTATMLDTMQQAMIRMLDRMDALEQAPARAVPGPTPAAEASLAAVRSVEPQPQPQPQPQSPQPLHIEERSSPAMAVEPVRETLAINPAQAPLAPARQVPRPVAVEQPAGPREPELEMPASAAAAAAAKQRNREDFVAAARRAMQQTASQQPAANEPDDEGELELPPKAAKSKRSKGGEDASKRAGMLAGGKGLKPSLLVAAIALLALGGAYTMLRTMRPPAVSTVKVERKAPATVIDPSGKAQSSSPEAEPDEKSEGGLKVPGSAMEKSKASANDVDPAKRAESVLSPVAPSPVVQPSPMPSPRPSRTTVPETVTDDLSDAKGSEEQQAQPELAEPAKPRALAEVLKGVTVQQSPQAPSVNELIRARQQQGMAMLSGQVGAAQPAATVSQASLIKSDAGTAAALLAGAPATPAAGPIASAADLPPAMVGPLSLRLAASKGDPSAEFEVGARFAEGKGVQQDFKQALNWYQRAASQGFAPAQYRLATLFERGLGVKADAARAKVWYTRAAEQGNIKAMHNLAVLSAGRDMASPDYATAARWFREAADRGLADSQYNLGVLLENGLGVERDTKEAYKWLSLAARGGDKEAARRKDALYTRMTPAEQRAATELLEAWKPAPADVMMNDARAAGEAWKVRAPGQQPG